MTPNLLADAVLLVHFGFIIFVIFGGLLAYWRPRAALLHIPALAWGILVEVCGWTCPLTPLEHRLRFGSQSDLPPGAIERLLMPVLYPEALSRPVQIGFGLALLFFNAAVYARLRRYQSRRATG